jgi:hypothetical protein
MKRRIDSKNHRERIAVWKDKVSVCVDHLPFGEVPTLEDRGLYLD